MHPIRKSSALIAAAVLAWGSNAMAFQPPGCEQRKALSQATSPDGAWVATIFNNICNDGAFVTVITDSVEITRPDEKPAPIPRTGVVFGMDDHPLTSQRRYQ